MDKIDYLFKSGKITRIVETERDRYLNFFSYSYKENLKLSRHIQSDYPRWSIITGYYAMHDLAKLFLADKFSIKVELNVHKTVIDIFRALVKNIELEKLLDIGYKELIKLLNDLIAAKKDRTKAQYYTGTKFMKDKYKKEAKIFLNDTVMPFIDKIKMEKKNAY
ncbi:MAG: hypothetical protein AABX54_02810 [Nanoarchaeota archaeon]